MANTAVRWQRGQKPSSQMVYETGQGASIQLVQESQPSKHNVQRLDFLFDGLRHAGGCEDSDIQFRHRLGHSKSTSYHMFETY